jgi:hypothetical protein
MRQNRLLAQGSRLMAQLPRGAVAQSVAPFTRYESRRVHSRDEFPVRPKPKAMRPEPEFVTSRLVIPGRNPDQAAAPRLAPGRANFPDERLTPRPEAAGAQDRFDCAVGFDDIGLRQCDPPAEVLGCEPPHGWSLSLGSRSLGLGAWAVLGPQSVPGPWSVVRPLNGRFHHFVTATHDQRPMTIWVPARMRSERRLGPAASRA